MAYARSMLMAQQALDARDAETHAALGLRWLAASVTVKGPVSERILAALDKPVKLGPKGEKVPLDKALEIFKTQAGFDVPIRPGLPTPLPVVVSEGEELPLGAWLQLYQDTAWTPFAKPICRSNPGTSRIRRSGITAASNFKLPTT